MSIRSSIPNNPPGSVIPRAVARIDQMVFDPISDDPISDQAALKLKRSLIQPVIDAFATAGETGCTR